MQNTFKQKQLVLNKFREKKLQNNEKNVNEDFSEERRQLLKELLKEAKKMRESGQNLNLLQ